MIYNTKQKGIYASMTFNKTRADFTYNVNFLEGVNVKVGLWNKMKFETVMFSDKPPGID